MTTGEKLNNALLPSTPSRRAAEKVLGGKA